MTWKEFKDRCEWDGVTDQMELSDATLHWGMDDDADHGPFSFTISIENNKVRMWSS